MRATLTALITVPLVALGGLACAGSDSIPVPTAPPTTATEVQELAVGIPNVSDECGSALRILATVINAEGDVIAAAGNVVATSCTPDELAASIEYVEEMTGG